MLRLAYVYVCVFALFMEHRPRDRKTDRQSKEEKETDIWVGLNFIWGLSYHLATSIIITGLPCIDIMIWHNLLNSFFSRICFSSFKILCMPLSCSYKANFSCFNLIIFGVNFQTAFLFCSIVCEHLWFATNSGDLNRILVWYFKCHLNTRLNFVRYSNGGLNTVPPFEYGNLNTGQVIVHYSDVSIIQIFYSGPYGNDIRT